MLKDCIKGNIDILLISETKLGECFPIGQFQIEDFSTLYRKDRDKNGGGILLYVREDIPSKLVSFKNDDTNIEHFFIGINLREIGFYHTLITRFQIWLKHIWMI